MAKAERQRGWSSPSARNFLLPVSLHQRERKWQICEKFSTNWATAGLLVSISLISDVKRMPGTSAVSSVLSSAPFSSRRSSGLASRTVLRYRMSSLFSSSDSSSDSSSNPDSSSDSSSNPDSDSAPGAAAASRGSGGQRGQRRPAGSAAVSLESPAVRTWAEVIPAIGVGDFSLGRYGAKGL